MHKLLQRQLKKLSIAKGEMPDKLHWMLLLERISQSYDDVDRDRYTVQRSLDISSLEMKALYAQQRESLEARQALILNAIPDVLFLLDEEGRYVDILANDGSSLLYDDRAALIGKKLHDVLPKESADQFLDTIHKALKTGELQKIRYQLDVGKGLVHFEGRVTSTQQQEKDKATVLFLARDVSDVVEAENQQKLLNTVMDSAQDGLVVVRADKKVLYANQAMADITGIKVSTLLSEGEGFLRHEKDFELCLEICQLANDNDHLQKEISIHIGQDQIVPVLLNLTTVRNNNGGIEYFFGVLTDMAILKKSKELLLFNATHDSLTGLPNRLMFEDRFKYSLARAKRSGISGALLFLDLDDFKKVNDSLGHDAGDALLKEVSDRMRSVCRDVDTVARFGGDEFVLLLENMGNRNNVIQLLDNLFEKFRKKFTFQDNAIEVSASVGVTIFPEQGGDAAMLVKQADLAMYAAKKLGKNQYYFFIQD